MHYELHESNTCITRPVKISTILLDRRSEACCQPSSQHFGWVVAVKGIGYKLHIEYTYRVSKKKMSFLGKIAITTLKLIQNAKVGGVSENSGYLLSNGH